MNAKLKQIVTKERLQQLQDPRVVGLLIFGGLLLLVSWNAVGIIQTNYELQKKISRLQQENEVHSLSNTNLRLKNQYLETDNFLELAARRQFGKAAPGEAVLVVPKEIALRYTTETAKDQETTDSIKDANKPWYQKNLDAWLDFLLHRQD